MTKGIELGRSLNYCVVQLTSFLQANWVSPILLALSYTNMRIKIVFFDALHTIVKLRQPIHIQYQEVFAPYFSTDPSKIKASFKKGISLVARYDGSHS
jgi:hypothetical protein